MKTTLLTLAATAVLSAPAMAQSGVMAHWDFVDGTTGSASLYPEDNGIDCITPKKVTPEGLGYSWSTRDSEDGSRYGANCFGGWSSRDCVIFGVDFANEAVAKVSEINFDVGNYGRYSSGSGYNINQVALRIWKNGAEITTSGQFIKNFNDGTSSSPWTPGSDTIFDVSALDISSANGSSDEYKFAIFVTDKKYGPETRIALDNFRVIGKYECVPEPSSAALLGLAGMAMLVRRKR